MFDTVQRKGFSEIGGMAISKLQLQIILRVETLLLKL